MPRKAKSGSKTSKKSSTKRKVSSYNKFVGVQMKKGKSMKQAAVLWKKSC